MLSSNYQANFIDSINCSSSSQIIAFTNFVVSLELEDCPNGWGKFQDEALFQKSNFLFESDQWTCQNVG